MLKYLHMYHNRLQRLVNINVILGKSIRSTFSHGKSQLLQDFKIINRSKTDNIGLKTGITLVLSGPASFLTCRQLYTTEEIV